MRIVLMGATGQIGFALSNALSKTLHQVSVLVRDARQASPSGQCARARGPNLHPGGFADGAARRRRRHLRGRCPRSADSRRADVAADQLRDATDLSRGARPIIRSPPDLHLHSGSLPARQRPRARGQPAHRPQGCDALRAAPCLEAYQLVRQRAAELGLVLTIIHPTGVYGGLNTGFGLNNYMENLLNRRSSKVPMIVDSRFPVVHVENLAAGVVLALDKPGSFLFCDQMTSMKDIALLLRRHANAYVPPVVPVWAVRRATSTAEGLARLTHSLPMMTSAQVRFIVESGETKADHSAARAVLATDAGGSRRTEVPAGPEDAAGDA